MLEKLQKNKNCSKCVIISPFDIKFYDSISYTIGNELIYNDKEDITEFINYVNSSKIKKIYFFGFNEAFKYIIPRLRMTIEKCWIFKDSLSSLSNSDIRGILNTIMDYYDKCFINSIGCINMDNKIVLENAGYKVEFIDLKIKKKKHKKVESNSIGLLSNDFDPNNNVYNQLASLTLLNYDICKLSCYLDSSFHFCDYFKIKYKYYENLDDVMKNNFVNLYINYTNTNKELIMKSFNYGVPVIVGNTDFYDNNLYLKDNLVVKSDDINEIVEKVNFVKDNYKKIMEEYMKDW